MGAADFPYGLWETACGGGTERDMGGWESAPRKYGELVQQAREILIRERAFSVEQANSYLYEIAQARKLFIVEVAGRIVAREGVWTEVSSGLNPADAGTWLGRW